MTALPLSSAQRRWAKLQRIGKRGLIFRFALYLAGSVLPVLALTFYFLADLAIDPALRSSAWAGWILRATLILVAAVVLGALLGALTWRIEEARHRSDHA